jgi:C1A family cysteine protease
MLAVNEFSHISHDEYRNMLGTRVPKFQIKKTISNTIHLSDYLLQRDIKFQEDEELPQSVNWVLKNAVSPVKRQYHCGACWAFTAVCFST